MDPVLIGGIAAASIAGLGVSLVAGGLWWAGRVTRGLRSLGYLRQPNGTFTRVVGPVRVEFRPPRRWVVRTGMYLPIDLTARTGRSRDSELSSGDPALDRRYGFGSARPSYAVHALRDPGVIRALAALPAKEVTLRGDELVVTVTRPRRWMHDAVVDLATAITRTADQLKPL